MSYYGSGYSQGVNQRFSPIQSSAQGAPIGFNAVQSAPTMDAAKMNQPNAADQIAGNPMGMLGKSQNYGGAVNEQQQLGGTPAWANKYIGDLAGNGASSGQMNDAFYQGAPTLGAIYSQYGAGFDPSKFTGLGDGSLMGLQNSLGQQGYGLDNLGGYYQNQSISGPMAGVQYGFDPNFGLTGSIGGLNFDVARLPGGKLSDGSDAGSTNYSNYLANQWSKYGAGINGSQLENAYSRVGYDPNKFRAFNYAGSGFYNSPNAQMGQNWAQNGRAVNSPMPYDNSNGRARGY